MANIVFDTNFGEGQSFHRPPLFKGDNYLYWKTRMTLFLKSNDINTWLIVKNGDKIPMKIVNEISVPKTDDEMVKADLDLIQQNAKALNILFCALDVDVFNKVSACDSAKEAWDKLEITYEGTNQVKENKISMLMHEYELFSMRPHENVNDMFSRFTNILNALKSLGKVFLNAEIVRKILRSLPEHWDAKVTAIQEAKDLTKLNMDELLGSLMTYEQHMQNRTKKEPDHSLALKSKMSYEDSDESDESDNEDIAVMLRKIKKFLRKKKTSSSSFKDDKQKGDIRNKDAVTCYECKGIGHYKSECPNLKKEKNFRNKNEKKKAFKAVTWDSFYSSDSENESSDGEVANLCFMASHDEVKQNSSSSSKLKSDYDELEENFLLLVNVYNSLKNKSRILKKDSKSFIEEISYLKNENESLQEKLLFSIESQKELNQIIEEKQEITSNDSLEKENEILKIKVDDLNTTLNKFTTSTDTLNKIIGSQRCSFNKAGIGYTSHEKLYKNFFVKEKEIHDCKMCGRLFKESHSCPLKKKFYDSKGKPFIKVWIIKESKNVFANPIGPNKKWVPKVS